MFRVQVNGLKTYGVGKMSDYDANEHYRRRALMGEASEKARQDGYMGNDPLTNDMLRHNDDMNDSSARISSLFNNTSGAESRGSEYLPSVVRLSPEVEARLKAEADVRRKAEAVRTKCVFVSMAASFVIILVLVLISNERTPFLREPISSTIVLIFISLIVGAVANAAIAIIQLLFFNKNKNS